MTLLELLQELRTRGIRLQRLRGMLTYDCPAGVLTQEITWTIRYYEGALTDLLEQQAPGAPRAIRERKK